MYIQKRNNDIRQGPQFVGLLFLCRNTSNTSFWRCFCFELAIEASSSYVGSNGVVARELVQKSIPLNKIGVVGLISKTDWSCLKTLT